MQRPNRIYFDVEDGVIIYMTGQAEGDVLPFKENQQVDYVDVPFDSINFMKESIVSINPETKEVITEPVDYRSEEQKKIDALEEEILTLMGVV